MKPSYLHRLTLRQIEIFQTVCRLRSYSLAAEELALTQPAVSTQVRQLENVVGEPLLSYVGKRLYLTPTGEAVEKAARDLQARLVTLEMELSELEGVIQGTLSLAIESSAQYFLPGLMKQFHDLHTAVEIQLHVMNHAEAMRRMAINQHDLTITGLVPNDRSLTFTPFRENKLVAVAAPEHPLGEADSVSLLRLAEEKLLARESGSGTRQAFEQHCLERGVRFPDTRQLGSLEALKAGVAANLGIAVLPLDACTAELAMGRLKQLAVADFPLRRSWCIVYPKGKHLTPVARQFLTFLLGQR
jgi:LysR family transcriptional regulator, putative pyruvate carboxylase regulator